MSRSAFDVDKYRTEFECDEHWELRRKFLLAHKDKFPEDELVCLAQTFTNIEFLGCRYPQKTMEKVAALAKGVVDEYREKQKGRLQRTFVAASDAAGAKVKGLKRPQTDATPSPVPIKQSKVSATTPSPVAGRQSPSSDSTPTPIPGKRSRFSDATSAPAPGKQSRFSEELRSPAVIDLTEEHRSPAVVDLTADTPPLKPQVLYGPSIRSLVSEKVPPPSSRYGGVRTYHITKEPPKLELTSKYGKLLIIEVENVNPTNILAHSMNVANINFSFQTELTPHNKVLAKLFVDNELVVQCEDYNVRAAKETAARLGLQKLKESCWTIKVKHKFLSETTVDKSLTHKQMQEQGQSIEMADMDTPLASDNVGNKLLRLMGWSGGGLGRDAEGIVEPISVPRETVRRAGFGSGQGGGSLTLAQFRQQAVRLLQDYASRDTGHDLVFTSEFTSDERRLLHQLGHKLKLKTKSYGKKDEDRFLVISKKVSLWDEANKLLSSGGCNDRYELIPPHTTPP